MLTIGIDLGGTNTKGMIYSRDGQTVAALSFPTPIHRQRGLVDYYPQEIWQRTCELLRGLIHQCPRPQGVVALALSSLGESGVAVNGRGEALAPSIANSDRRPQALMAAWRKQIDDREVYAITGQRISALSSLAKMLWEREYLPEIRRDTQKWLFLTSYLTLKLVGEYQTDCSLATRSMLYDIHERRWSEHMCELAGIDIDLLPPVVPSGTPLGPIRPEVCDEFGLSQGIMVSVGGHDQPCAAYSLGLTGTDLMDSTGTGEVLYTLVDPSQLCGDPLQMGVALGCHVQGDQLYAMGGGSAGGRHLDRVLGHLFEDGEPSSTTRLYDAMTAEAASSPVGSNGLSLIPHSRPLDEILSLRDQHGLGDLSRALLEGLALELCNNMTRFEALVGRCYPRVACIGGGSRNALWTQIKADISGREFVTRGSGENACLGAAMLAGLGARVYQNYDEAIGSLKVPRRVYRPDPEDSEAYAELLRRHYGGPE